MLGQVPRCAIAAVVLVGLAGCTGPELRPAAEATPAVLRGEAAVAKDAGVQMAVSTGAWDARPVDLEMVLTPVLVEILNQSSRPLRIGYDAFQFSSLEAGQSYAALPPYSIQAEAVRPVSGGRPYYPYTGFGGAPYLRGYYPQLGIYSGPFAFSDGYYAAYAPVWSGYRPVELPTEDMLERALPEGVVEPGGRVGGFLYFQRIKGSGSFTFSADLLDARTGERFGAIAILFVAD
jgi:hypothetical protein